MTINPFDILKNAKELQERMGFFQKKMNGVTETGSAGGGMVEIEMNGRMEVVKVRILPEAVADIEMLQDLIAAALASVLDKIKEALNREIGATIGAPASIASSLLSDFPGFGKDSS
jgi:DNA-binding YbaB/EbfC family protein